MSDIPLYSYRFDNCSTCLLIQIHKIQQFQKPFPQTDRTTTTYYNSPVLGVVRRLRLARWVYDGFRLNGLLGGPGEPVRVVAVGSGTVRTVAVAATAPYRTVAVRCCGGVGGFQVVVGIRAQRQSLVIAVV